MKEKFKLTPCSGEIRKAVAELILLFTTLPLLMELLQCFSAERGQLNTAAADRAVAVMRKRGMANPSLNAAAPIWRKEEEGQQMFANLSLRRASKHALFLARTRLCWMCSPPFQIVEGHFVKESC